MNCKNLRVRTLKYQKYIFCTIKHKEIFFKDCKNCKHKKYKDTKEINKKTNKMKRLERRRNSILTDNLEICYICKNKRKEDLHEIFGGSNRKKSMIWGLVIPTCRECHQEWDTNKDLRETIQKYTQNLFENKYNHQIFMQEFKKNYL